MHADCGAIAEEYCGRPSGQCIFTCLLCLMMVVACLPFARAEGDIVYAAEYYRMSGQYYRWPYSGKLEEKLESNGRSHLYRINPDGTGRKQLTYGDLDGNDYDPKWSPDGKSILFMRVEHLEHSQRYVLCLIGQNGGVVRRLLALSEEERGNFGFSPDGCRVIHCTPEFPADGSYVHVIDLQTGRDRKLPPATTYAWSPDCRQLLLLSSNYRTAVCRLWSVADDTVKTVKMPLRHPLWLDSSTLVGGMPLQCDQLESGTLRMMKADGQELRRIPLRLSRPLKKHKKEKDEEDDFAWDEQGQLYRIPHNMTLLIAVTCHHMSDGGHYACHLIDLSAGTRQHLYAGRLIGISPDGSRIAVAAHEWVGPYKRGGAWVGALTIVSLKTGMQTAITGPLISVMGGDWRVTPR